MLERRPGARELSLVGEVDLSTWEELRDALILDVDELDIDLSGLSFIDGRGVGLLADAQRRSHERGGQVRLRHAWGPVRRVFELLGLRGVLDD